MIAQEVVIYEPKIAYFRHKGCAMAPTIHRDEIVPVDTSVTSFIGPGIYLTDWRDFTPSRIMPRRCPALRRLDYIGGVLHSVSDNKEFPPFPISLEDIVIGGKLAVV